MLLVTKLLKSMTKLPHFADCAESYLGCAGCQSAHGGSKTRRISPSTNRNSTNRQHS